MEFQMSLNPNLLELPVLCVLQARMGSRRLPGKVLADVVGKPMILRQIERVRSSAVGDKIVIATSTDETDDVLAEALKGEGLEVFRGDLADVSSRFMGAMRMYEPHNVMRLTADCPLTDPAVITRVMEEHLSSAAEYTSNFVARTFPKGLDVEVFRAESFERLISLGLSDDEKEHVTLGFYLRPEDFTIRSVEQSPDRSALRWTVDFEEDLEFVRQVYTKLYSHSELFTSEDIVETGLTNVRRELN